MHLRPLLTLATLLISASATTAQVPPTLVPTWEKLGPLVGAGASVHELVATPAAPSRIFASTSAGVVMSEDRGQTWAVRSRYLPAVGLRGALGASPSDPNRLLMRPYTGPLVLSTDAGLTWREVTSPPSTITPFGVRFAPSDGNIAYACGPQALWRTADAGETWAPVLEDPVLMSGYAYRMAVDNADADHVYVFTLYQGLFETEDGGASWTRTDYPSDWTSAPLAVAIDPNDGDRLMMGGKGVKLTTDGGATWTDVGPTFGELFDALAFSPTHSATLFAGVRGLGFASSLDSGATWTLNTDPGLVASGDLPVGLLPSESHPGEILLGSGGGFFRSVDDGSTWERRNQGLEAHAYVMALTVDAFDPARLVAKTGASAFYSTDGGATWTESTSGTGFVSYDLAADPHVPGRFYAGAWLGGMWRSDDGGATFTKTFDSYDVWFARIAAHPTVPGRIFGAGRGVQRSDDGGVTFTKTSLPENWCWSIAISPVDPDVMYAGTDTVYTSLDGGTTWTAATTPPSGIVRKLVADPVAPMRAYAASPGNGVYRTDDGGATWTRQDPDLNWLTSIALPSSHPGLLFTGDARFAKGYFSRDGGVSNVPISRGLESMLKEFAASPTQLFGATGGDGVLVLRD